MNMELHYHLAGRIIHIGHNHRKYDEKIILKVECLIKTLID